MRIADQNILVEAKRTTDGASNGTSIDNATAHSALESADTTPEASADRIAEQWARAAGSIIQACAYLVQALNAFENLPENLNALLSRLVAKRVLSENDKLSRLKANGKLAMLGKIGRNADTLLLPSVLCLLPAHYSIIYQICLLIEEVGRERAVAALTGHHDTSREDVIKIRAELKAPKIRPEQVKPPAPGANEAQLFAVRFTNQEARTFANDYARSDTLDECLHRPQPADNAGLVAIVPMRMLGTFERALMPLLGFGAPNGFFLQAVLNQPEITDRDVIVVARRGSFRPRPLTVFPSDAGNVLKLAEYFFPECTVKCQLFAAARADGWLTLIDDENWNERPSIR